MNIRNGTYLGLAMATLGLAILACTPGQRTIARDATGAVCPFVVQALQGPDWLCATLDEINALTPQGGMSSPVKDPYTAILAMRAR